MHGRSIFVPNRIIREGLVTSKKVTSMSEAAQLFYVLLLLKADDFGRFDAHPTLLRAACYPYRIDAKTDVQVSGYLKECAIAALIQLYSVDGKDFLFIFNFRQQTRQNKSKYPHPPTQCLASDNHIDEQLLSEPINKCTPLSYSSVVVGDDCRMSIIADDKSSKPSAKKPKPRVAMKPDSIEECVAFVTDKLQLPRTDGVWLWDHWMANGFAINGRKMASWKHAASNWKTQRYSPSLKGQKR